MRLIDAHSSSEPVGGFGCRGAGSLRAPVAWRWQCACMRRVPSGGPSRPRVTTCLVIALRVVRYHCSHSCGPLWFAVGVQEQVPAERAAAVLPAEQAERAGVEQWPAFAAPFGPVAGLGGVIGGCPAPDQRVPDDLSPGELGHVGAAGAVAEYPVVLPGFVVPAEVARLVIQVFGLREWRWQAHL